MDEQVIGIRLVSVGSSTPPVAIVDCVRAAGLNPMPSQPAGEARRAKQLPVLLIPPEPAQPGEDLATWVRAHSPEGPVLGLFLSEPNGRVSNLIEHLADFLVWPCSPAELAARVGRLLGGGAAQVYAHGIVGDCPSLCEAQGVLQRYQRCEAPVLILGESGTGKELVARSVHYSSARADGPFVPVNCGALPDDLLENELFGHERGAFTGAREKSVGLVEQADGGTLFLDEVGTLSAKGQCSLLRFLQCQEFKRLGGDRLRRANVRILAATNADLRLLAARGEFREDLLYRLDILSVTLPPLRQRGADIEALAKHFLRRFCAEYRIGTKLLSPAARDWLYQYRWPGNVRELENAVHRAVLLSSGGCIQLADLCPGRHGERQADELDDGPELNFQRAKAEVIKNFERKYLIALMERSGGNVSEAARQAGKERRALGKLLKKHGIDRKHYDLG